MVRIKLESELKFTMSGGNVFHRFTMRSVKELNLELTQFRSKTQTE